LIRPSMTLARILPPDKEMFKEIGKTDNDFTTNGIKGKARNRGMLRSIEIILFIACLLVLVSCTDEISQDIPAVERGNPDEVFTDFMTQESDSGMIKWRLTAPKASKFTAKNLVLLETPTILFFDDEGALQTTLTSKNGELYQDSRDMLAYGDVVVVSEKGDVLEADSLYWKDAEDKIVSHSFVKLRRGNDILTGIGLECDHNLSAVNIKKNVKATIIDEKGASDE
jgi:LPS export ABC transporter protein LptC